MAKTKWSNVATRLDPTERAELEVYRAEVGARSLNGAVRHWLQGRFADKRQVNEDDAALREMERTR